VNQSIGSDQKVLEVQRSQGVQNCAVRLPAETLTSRCVQEL